MPAVTELTPLARMVKEAGLKIRSMRQDIFDKKDWEEKSDGSRVTPADLEAHRMLKERASEIFPGVAFLSEEGTKEEIADALKHSIRLETDPLDNTGAYTGGKSGDLKKNIGYSVNVGLVKNGVPIEGAIYFPEKEEMYFTGKDGNAYFQKGEGPIRQISVKKGKLRNPVEVVSGFNETHLEHLGDREVNKVQQPGQYRAMKVADGTADVTGFNMGVGGFNTYDVAGPDAVTRAAGGMYVDRNGNPIVYGDSTKVPDHVVGSIDALIELGLTTRAQLPGQMQKYC